jgi:hypothetical protein
MPNKVIALVYPHSGDHEYETTASTDTKRLLRKANKAVSEYYDGRYVGTVWGDPRGKTASGDPVMGYAICMTTTKEDVAWLIDTFWDTGEAGFTEMIDGVGYTNKSQGRVRMFALDTSQGEAGVETFLEELTGMQLKVPRPAPKPEAKITPKENERVVAALKAALAGEEVDLMAVIDELPEPVINDPHGLLPAVEEEQEQPVVDIAALDELDVEDDPELKAGFAELNKAALRVECDKRGITYRKKDTNAQLISLLG